jgi:hypothetical protein
MAWVNGSDIRTGVDLGLGDTPVEKIFSSAAIVPDRQW